MKNYKETIELLAGDKYGDRVAGTPVARFEGLKVAAFVFEKKIAEVHADVEARIVEIQEGA